MKVTVFLSEVVNQALHPYLEVSSKEGEPVLGSNLFHAREEEGNNGVQEENNSERIFLVSSFEGENELNV